MEDPTYGTNRDGDGRRYEKLINDTHRKQLEQGRRPARAGDEDFNGVLHNIIMRIGTVWIAWCKRQIVDDDGVEREVLEGWVWVPANGAWEYVNHYNLPEEPHRPPPSRM